LSSVVDVDRDDRDDDDDDDDDDLSLFVALRILSLREVLVLTFLASVLVVAVGGDDDTNDGDVMLIDCLRDAIPVRLL